MTKEIYRLILDDAQVELRRAGHYALAHELNDIRDYITDQPVRELTDETMGE